MQFSEVALDALESILGVFDHLEAGAVEAVEPAFADEAGNGGSWTLAATAIDRVGAVQERFYSVFKAPHVPDIQQLPLICHIVHFQALLMKVKFLISIKRHKWSNQRRLNLTMLINRGLSVAK